MLRLNALDRIASSVAAGLGTIGTVALIASLAGVWTGIAAPTTVSPPAPVVTGGAAPTGDDLMQLTQVAGTFSYLVRQDSVTSGRFPAAVVPTSDNVLVLAAGSVQVPQGTAAEYVVAADGTSYVLTLTTASGLTVIMDSTLGYIQSYAPQP